MLNKKLNVLDGLIPYIKTRECVLFIGAGMSQIAGCKPWHWIADQLCLRHPDPSLRNLSDLKNITYLPNYIEACFLQYKSANKENEYEGVIREAIYENGQLLETAYKPFMQNIIDKIKPKFILTTNIDGCFEKSGFVNLANISYKSQDMNITKLNNPKLQSFHIHGYIDTLFESVLMDKTYYQRYQDGNLSLFFEHILSHYTILFLGYGLKEHKLLEILKSRKSNKHYALLSTDEFNSTEIKMYLELFNISIVEYGDVNMFQQFLTEWCNINLTNPAEIKEEKIRPSPEH